MTPRWSCATCQVTARYTDPSRVDPPAGWTEDRGSWRCLACGREAAVEAALAAADPKAKPGRVKAEALARFELERDADRTDAMIAKVAGTFAAVVGSVRSQLLATGEIRARTGSPKPKPAPPPRPKPARYAELHARIDAELRRSPGDPNAAIAVRLDCTPGTISARRRKLEAAGSIPRVERRGGRREKAKQP